MVQLTFNLDTKACQHNRHTLFSPERSLVYLCLPIKQLGWLDIVLVGWLFVCITLLVNRFCDCSCYSYYHYKYTVENCCTFGWDFLFPCSVQISTWKLTHTETHTHTHFNSNQLRSVDDGEKWIKQVNKSTCWTRLKLSSHLNITFTIVHNSCKKDELN